MIKKMFVLERDYAKILKNSKDFQNSKPAGVTFVGKKRYWVAVDVVPRYRLKTRNGVKKIDI